MIVGKAAAPAVSLVAAGALALAGLTAGPPATDPPPDPRPGSGGAAPRPVAADTQVAAALAESAGGLLDLLDRAPAARDWKAARPAGSLAALGGGSEDPEDRMRRRQRTVSVAGDGWCGRGEAPLALPTGDTARLTVHFYPPRPGPPDALPAPDAPPETWLDGCRAGAVRVTLGVPPGEGPGRAETLVRRLEGRLGPPSGSLLPAVPTGLLLDAGALWRPRGGKAIAGYARLDTALVVAMADSASAVGPERYRSWRQEDRRLSGELTARADSLGLEALPLAETRRLLDAAFGEAGDGGDGRKDIEVASAFFSLVGAWKSAADTLPPEERAAAYLLGNRLLAEMIPVARRAVIRSLRDSAPSRRLRDSTVVRRLQPHGVEFQGSTLGATDVYTHSWLRQARELAPGGTETADRAFVELLRRGMDTSRICADGAAQFATVIREGRWFLERRGAEADRAVLADVHRLVADAFADVVTLAAGVTYSSMYVSADDFPLPPARARREAVAHYREALRRIRDPDEARKVWRDAWRIAAGLPRERTRFVCIYD